MRSRHGLVVAALVALGTAVAAPVWAGEPIPPDIYINRQSDNVLIPIGGSFDIGTTPLGTPIEAMIVVGNAENSGTLFIYQVTAPTGFTITQAPPGTIAAGAAHVVKIQCDADEPGVQSGQFSLDSSDTDEEPYTFTVSCTVTGGAVDTTQPSDTTQPADTTPASSDAATTSEGGQGSGGTLPDSGSSTAQLLAIVAGLLFVGGSAGLLARRRA